MKLHSKPARFLVTRMARAYGFMDPVPILAWLRSFAQPSEVGEPIELLRAGLLFHARGLVNTKAIQHNLDWVWPYWVERQFNPDDASFIPRAFSFSHINLTHRNWTAVGQPDLPYYPIVDPRGLVTPQFDGWSLDFWLVPEQGLPLFPSKEAEFNQEIEATDNIRIRSLARRASLWLRSDVRMTAENGAPCCAISLQADAGPRGFLAVALRPYNPEGVSMVRRIEPLLGRHGWRIDDRHEVWFDDAPVRSLYSSYAEGDVSLRLAEDIPAVGVKCPAGMATAAALFPVSGLAEHPIVVRVPIYDELSPRKKPGATTTPSWTEAKQGLARLELPEPRYQRLYDLALAGVILHSPCDVYPGPYTYKRFWFRDAVLILQVLLALGGTERTRRAINQFGPRQRRDGYFLSQEGEWDSNGQVLWLYDRFRRLTGEALPEAWLDAARRGARWISRKRLPRDSGRKEAGLLPAGFSAEHLGPNDFYYWDDFWAVGGLQGTARIFQETDPKLAQECREEAAEFLATIERSIPSGPQRRFPGAIPASPYRRMDSGAIGSVVADYPLQLLPPGDSRMLLTADFLRAHSFHHGVFMQDMIHSGLNVYLTLHLAQVWLRAGKPESVWALMDRVAVLASPTGQWPEAIHPRTLGGCMGDGQHIWAAAEWLMLLRNLFVRDEGERLILGAGIAPAWLEAGPAALGPVLTPHGPVTVRFSREAGGVRAELEARWRTVAPELEFSLPGCRTLTVTAGDIRNEFSLPFTT
jgi:hypothetical protein